MSNGLNNAKIIHRIRVLQMEALYSIESIHIQYKTFNQNWK